MFVSSAQNVRLIKARQRVKELRKDWGKRAVVNSAAWVRMRASGRERMSRERESVGARAVYIDRSPLSHQRGSRFWLSRSPQEGR
jgi:hypothetical protein